MRTLRLGRFAAVAAFAVVAVACGGGTGGGGGGNKGTIAIGVDLPESGAAASSGLPTLNGVKYAISKAGGSVSGWTLAVENRDVTRAHEVPGITTPQLIGIEKLGVEAVLPR